MWSKKGSAILTLSQVSFWHTFDYAWYVMYLTSFCTDWLIILTCDPILFPLACKTFFLYELLTLLLTYSMTYDSTLFTSGMHDFFVWMTYSITDFLYDFWLILLLTSSMTDLFYSLQACKTFLYLTDFSLHFEAPVHALTKVKGDWRKSLYTCETIYNCHRLTDWLTDWLNHH